MSLLTCGRIATCPLDVRLRLPLEVLDQLEVLILEALDLPEVLILEVLDQLEVLILEVLDLLEVLILEALDLLEVLILEVLDLLEVLILEALDQLEVLILEVQDQLEVLILEVHPAVPHQDLTQERLVCSHSNTTILCTLSAPMSSLVPPGAPPRLMLMATLSSASGVSAPAPAPEHPPALVSARPPVAQLLVNLVSSPSPSMECPTAAVLTGSIPVTHNHLEPPGVQPW